MKHFKITFRNGRTIVVEGHRFGYTHKDYGYVFIRDSEDNELFNAAQNEVLSIVDISQERQDFLHAILPQYNKNVFIVHGHNEKAKYELKSFLSDISLNPIILHEQDDKGLTIIEKFELYASQCSFACVLLTPDGENIAPNDTEQKWRARQNVIMEMGWFMARLGRERVILLYQGNTELPSDIYGILYLHFNDSILEATEKIRKRFKGLGVIE